MRLFTKFQSSFSLSILAVCLLSHVVKAQPDTSSLKKLFDYPIIKNLKKGERFVLKNIFSTMHAYYNNYRGQDDIDATYKEQVFDYLGSVKDSLFFEKDKYLLVFGPMNEIYLRGFISLNQLQQINKMLIGRKYFVTSQSWLSDSPSENLKYTEITIDSIVFDQGALPYRVYFVTKAGVKGSVVVAFSSDADLEAFQFETWFSTEDPRKKLGLEHSNFWTSIQQGIVRTGMTQKEVSTAWGPAKEIKRIENESGIVEEWTYEGKKSVIFTLRKEPKSDIYRLVCTSITT